MNTDDAIKNGISEMYNIKYFCPPADIYSLSLSFVVDR